MSNSKGLDKAHSSNAHGITPLYIIHIVCNTVLGGQQMSFNAILVVFCT